MVGEDAQLMLVAPCSSGSEVSVPAVPSIFDPTKTTFPSVSSQALRPGWTVLGWSFWTEKLHSSVVWSGLLRPGAHRGILPLLKLHPASLDTVSSEAFPLGPGQRSCWELLPPPPASLGSRRLGTGRAFCLAWLVGKRLALAFCFDSCI